MPELLEENQRIYEFFHLGESQWRVGPSGAYALDYGVIIEMAKAMNIEVDGAFFEKLKTFEGAILSKIQKKSEESKVENNRGENGRSNNSNKRRR